MAGEGVTSVREMLHRSASYHPENEAVVDERYRYSYREMLEKVKQTAALLHSLGVRKGDRVALMMLPSANHPLALFGAIELGAIPAALHIRESDQTLLELIDRLSPRVLVYDVSMEARVQSLMQQTNLVTGLVRATSGTSVDADIAAGRAPLIPDDLDNYTMDFEPMPIAADDIALIALSSGTTGVPKGVVHTHRGLLQGARGAVGLYGAKPTTRTLNILTTSFMAWVNVSFPIFNVGGTNVFVSAFNPGEYFKTAARERCSVLFLIPTMWRMVLRQDLDEFDLSGVERAMFAGEVMDLKTLQLLREKITPNVYNCYGTTETGTSAGTMMFPDDLQREEKLRSIGRPLANSEVRVIEIGGTADDELPPGEEGEILVKGPSRAVTFWNDPAKARQVFEGPWWHSGDLGSLDEENFLYIDGRIDDMIISGGINMMPSTIEDALLSHPGVSEACVIGVANKEWGQRVSAYLVPSDAGLTVESLEQFILDSALSHYQRPRHYEFVEELPKGNGGKVDRRALKKQVEAVTVQG
ncbi:MAG: class I adenylate-forming enzyme family protein [Gammaproteobacteria bacterium]